MKRKASRASSYETPAKLAKASSTVTVSKRLSSLRRNPSTPRKPMSPPKWPSVKRKSTASLPVPKWPTLVPTSAGKKASITSTSVEDVAEISEELPSPVPGLRRMSTLPLEEEKEDFSRKGSKTLSKTASKSVNKSGSSLAAVATLEKKSSVVTLDTSGSVTTVTRLASGSSVGEMTALSVAPASIRKELSKASSTASSKAALTKRVSSVRDAAEVEPRRSLSKSGSKSSSMRKEASVVPTPSASTPAVPLPPGGLIEIAFSFDTTGSMNACLDEVRGRVGDMIQRLQADIPGIRIAVIAHGDYCDEFIYVIKWIDFGASLPELSDFVQNIEGTGGGDIDECYELVLARAQTELSWTPGSQRSLVMIGDAEPHPPSYYKSRDEKLDWNVEVRKLADMGVKIYAVQALNRSESDHFYETLAQVTRGRHLRLDEFSNIFDIIMAVCYNERGVEMVQAYEEEVRTREGGAVLHKDLETLFRAFKTDDTGGSKLSKGASKVLSKGAAKSKTTTAARKTTAPKGKAKAAATKGKPGATAKVKGKTATAKGKVGAKTAAKKVKGKDGLTVKGKKTGKTLKGKKASKAAKGKKKQTTKAKKRVPGVKRKFREAEKDEDFDKTSCLKHVNWTPWRKAIVLSKPKGRNNHIFRPRMPRERYPGRRRRGLAQRDGFRNIQLCNDHSIIPAVYEVAVKLRSSKKYVMFFKACSSWRHNVVWDTVLLNTGWLHHEVNTVLANGGEIWLRRGNVKDNEMLKEVKRHITKLYDYAWDRRKQRGGKYRVRRVKKCNVMISGVSDR